MSEWLWGKNSVLEAFAAGKREIFEVLILPGVKNKLGAFLGEVQRRRVPLREVDKNELLEISQGGQHQGIAACVSPKPYSGFDEIVSYAKKKGELPFVVILDGVCDPQNFGAILRTAEFAGVHGVVVPLHGSVGMSPTVSRVSAGAMEYIRVVREKNLTSLIQRMKKMGFWIAGLFSGDGCSIFQTDLGSVPLGIVLGSEGSGIRPLVKKNCDFVVKIPEYGSVGSLNASAAAAVGIYEVVRQREKIASAI